jgi:hypothetical protein
MFLTFNCFAKNKLTHFFIYNRLHLMVILQNWI